MVGTTIKFDYHSSTYVYSYKGLVTGFAINQNENLLLVKTNDGDDEYFELHRMRQIEFVGGCDILSHIQ